MSCRIIAEIGWNHVGDMDLARDMVRAAAQAGADIVKFQTWRVGNLRAGRWDTDGRREIYEAAELSSDQHAMLSDFCTQHGVQFLTSVFSVRDLPILEPLDLPMIKIPSQEGHDAGLLRAVDGQFERVLVSTGACEWHEVLQIPELVTTSALTLMHCVSAYPCPPNKVNLPRLKALRSISESVGYSGHLPAVDDALAAIALGAEYVEKHFTLDRSLPGRDNRFALLPDELREICRFRDTWAQMSIDHGSDPQDCERDVQREYRGRWCGPRAPSSTAR